MGLFKKIFKPVAKVLDKVIPNEIKPALPYLASFAPFFGPTSGLMGQSMLKRALISGGLNIGAQLSQEGNEGDINLLSAGLGALSGAMTAPGAADTFAGATTKGTLADQGIIGSQARMELANRPLLTQAKDFGLESLAKGSKFIEKGLASNKLMDKAAVYSIPTATATGDVMQAQARQLEKQAAIDAALAEAEALADSGLRGDAIRNAMRAYGFFTDDEIEETVSSAGYKAGGRVGFRFGGIDAAIDKIETEKITELVESDKGGLDSIKDKMAGMGNVMKLFETPYGFDRDRFESMILEFKDYKQGGGDLGIYDFTIQFLDMVKKDTPKSDRTMAKEGGLMDLGGKEMDLRGGGFVPIGKKERADDVPARLSKNEFVMTADAVRAAGGGSVNKGAKRMYELMNNLEARV